MAATPLARTREIVEAYVATRVGATAATAAVDAAWHAPDPVALARPVTDLAKLFTRLRPHVGTFAVATSDDRQPTERTLEALGIAGAFAAIVCADDGVAPKPAPDPVLHLCRTVGIPPSRTAVVGDSPADLRMARAAGAARTIGVLTGVAERQSSSRSRTWSSARSPSSLPRVGALTGLRSRPVLLSYRSEPNRTVRFRSTAWCTSASRHRHRDTVSKGAAPSPMALAARPAPPAAELITLSEAARLAGVHRDTVRAWCARGELASLRHGPRGEVRIRRGDLQRLLDGRERRATDQAGPRTPVAAGTGGTLRPLRPIRTGSPSGTGSATSTDALRRLASELSGADALQPVLEEVLENSIRLFHADRAGLWLWHPAREHPLELVARQEFPSPSRSG